MTHYIDLQRTFSSFSKDDDPDSLEWRTLAHGSRTTWEDLLKERRVVILAEAGSGKTTEGHALASRLRADGKQAFFMRLELLAHRFETSFEVGRVEEWSTWLSTSEEAWLFLDSVDEARLRDPHEFESAIRTIGQQLEGASRRCHVYITSRPSAWRPATDPEFIERKLRVPPVATAEIQSAADLLTAVDVRSVRVSVPDSDSVLKLVKLDDLSNEQIDAYAKAKAVSDIKAFRDAIERADLEEFTTRPADLDPLIGIWKRFGKLGDRYDLMREAVESRLRERDQRRDEQQGLKSENVREDAQLLAAASTLSRQPEFAVPDGAKVAAGLSLEALLPKRSPRERVLLLQRPMFDEGSYGNVRIQNRVLRDFLSSEWFAKLFARQTSRRRLEALFFREQYGVAVIPPTLRPLLPWLALYDEGVRERLREKHPDLFFEGGDPRRLPGSLRQELLRKVCEALDADPKAWFLPQQVLRFAGPDLVPSIRELMGAGKSGERSKKLLLRMIYLGRLPGLESELQSVLDGPATSEVLRNEAARALMVTGTVAAKEKLRQSLTPGGTINRRWLAILLTELEPSRDSLRWILDRLPSLEQRSLHFEDELDAELGAYIERASLPIVAEAVQGIVTNVVESGGSAQSESDVFWTYRILCTAIFRLVESRHGAALKPAIVRGLLVVQSSGYEHQVLPDRHLPALAAAVSAWPELNDALFWTHTEVERTRRARMTQELTHWYQVTHRERFWTWPRESFDRALGYVSTRPLLDDKRVALSVVITTYCQSEPRSFARLRRLHRAAAGDPALLEDLRKALSKEVTPELRQQRQLQAENAAEVEQRQRRVAADHARWIGWLQGNTSSEKEFLRENRGTVTNGLTYLYSRIAEDGDNHNRWAKPNWRSLVQATGVEVAQFYRDAAVRLWREYDPPAPSAGGRKSVPWALIIGLTGIEIEAAETKGWAKALDDADVVLACRYAVHELNGFPPWLEALHRARASLVSEYLSTIVCGETAGEPGGILGSLAWSASWAWDGVAPTLIDWLSTNTSRTNLELQYMLRILQGSSVPDDQIAALARAKCELPAGRLDDVARWYAVWMGVAPADALVALLQVLEVITARSEREHFVMVFLVNLLGGRGGEGGEARRNFASPSHLKNLYLLIREHLRRDDDVTHDDLVVYAPGLRDEAQRARDQLLRELAAIEGKEAYLALREIAARVPTPEQPWIEQLAVDRATTDSEGAPWSCEQILEFQKSFERTPSNHAELYELAVQRLEDLKADLERGDHSDADLLLGLEETRLRTRFAQYLRQTANGRYSISQEDELVNEQRTDIRFLGSGFDGPVPLELKRAQQYPLMALRERLENQLCGDYLRDDRSSYGVYLLVNQEADFCRYDPETKEQLSLDGVVANLRAFWASIAANWPKVLGITVIGIDLTLRARVSGAARSPAATSKQVQTGRAASLRRPRRS